eukprot:3043008-Amphidinium_carterae.1
MLSVANDDDNDNNNNNNSSSNAEKHRPFLRATHQTLQVDRQLFSRIGKLNYKIYMSLEDHNITYVMDNVTSNEKSLQSWTSTTLTTSLGKKPL